MKVLSVHELKPEECAGEWMPDVVGGKRRRKYARPAVWKALEEERRERGTTIGLYRTQWVLIRNLGGRWIPRQKLEETQVLVGNRVWFPFVRARRYMRSCQSLLDASLTQLYRVAERHRD